MKKKVLIFSSIEGHASIAESIGQALPSDEYTYDIFTKPDPSLNVYRLFYQYLPSSNNIAYNLLSKKEVEPLVKKYLHTLYDGETQALLAKKKPDVIISTNFGFNPSLDTLHPPQAVYLSAVTDPRTFFPLNITLEADSNLAFDQELKDRIAAHPHLGQANVDAIGWFVRQQFEEVHARKTLRPQLGLHPDYLTLLISSGSEGTTMILKILPALVMSPQPVQVVVACGNNAPLLKGIKGLKKVLEKTNHPNKIIALGFTDKMHEYMEAADLVVGKAGPNTVFESVATHTPFFAITHISGQEDGNLDIIRDYQVGYVEESPLKAQKLLRDIIEQPEQLEQFTPHLKKLAAYNKDAKKKLVQLIEKLLTERR